jgi:hypothetical protein
MATPGPKKPRTTSLKVNCASTFGGYYRFSQARNKTAVVTPVQNFVAVRLLLASLLDTPGRQVKIWRPEYLLDRYGQSGWRKNLCSSRGTVAFVGSEGQR